MSRNADVRSIPRGMLVFDLRILKVHVPNVRRRREPTFICNECRNYAGDSKSITLQINRLWKCCSSWVTDITVWETEALSKGRHSYPWLIHWGMIMSIRCESFRLGEEEKREPIDSVSQGPKEGTRQRSPLLWRGMGGGAAVGSGCLAFLLFLTALGPEHVADLLSKAPMSVKVKGTHTIIPFSSHSANSCLWKRHT